MPANFTHVQFGKDVIETLPRSFSILANKYPQCFFAGTQGPDLLFYYKPWTGKKDDIRRQAWILHDEAAAPFFLRTAKLLVEDEKNYDEEGNFLPHTKEAEYLLGFLCHFCLDYTVHPFVEECLASGVSHVKIEAELDKHNLRKQNLPMPGYNGAKLAFPIKESAEAVANVLSIPKKEAKKALKSMRFINGLFSNKCELVHSICRGLLAIIGAQKPFGEMFLDKKDDERCIPLLETLDDLYNQAIATANAVITEFFANAKLSVQNNTLTNDIFRYNYGGVIPQEGNS